MCVMYNKVGNTCIEIMDYSHILQSVVYQVCIITASDVPFFFFVQRSLVWHFGGCSQEELLSLKQRVVMEMVSNN